MSFRLPPLPDWLEGGSGALASSMGGPRPHEGRRVEPAPGLDEEADGWPEGLGWPGGRLDDYEEEP